MRTAMTAAACLALLFAACGSEPEPDSESGAALPSPMSTTDGAAPMVVPVARCKGAIKVDGNSADAAWKLAREIIVPLSGPGPDRVAVRAVQNEEGVYLLLMWQDDTLSRGNVCRYEKPGIWKLHQGEDAALFFFPPSRSLARFRSEGLGGYEKDGQLYNPDRTGFADVWYWGAQTTRPHLRARDHWLPSNQTLRGDRQPDKSDNSLNWSADYEGPVAVPVRINKNATWYLPKGNRQQLTAKAMSRMDPSSNFGWTVSAVLHRMLKGSRGDVFVSARHSGSAWTLELGRRFDTGYRDDHVLGTTTLFAIALYDGTAKGARIGEYGLKAAVSNPLELQFLSES